MSPEQIAALSGANAYKGGHVGGSYYDTITLGKDGKFYLAHYSQPKDKREDPTLLGDTFAMTIIKVRSKLTRWQDNAQTLSSVEYDAGTEIVATTAGDITEKQAKEMGAKKSIIIYGLVNEKITKITVTGGSLYNPDDTEDLRLYSYLQSFEGDDHSFMVETVVTAKEVVYEYNGEKKLTYHMTFAKGAPNGDKELAVVGAKLTELIDQLKDNDARDLKFLGSTPKSAAPTVAGADNEINPDDIPF